MLVAILILSMCFGLVTAKATLSMVLSLMHRGVQSQVGATELSSQHTYETLPLQHTAPAA